MEVENHRFKKNDGTIEVDVLFDGLVYINATELYQKYNKSQQAFSWYKDNTLVPYAEKLIELGKIPQQGLFVVADNQVITVDNLIVVRMGGNNPSFRGTWLHSKLAIEFARWLDLEFGIWCNEKIEELLANGVVSLQAEDRKYVDILDGMFDKKAGNAWFMEQVHKLLLIHEQEGYNIKTFIYMLEVIRKNTEKEDHPKIFKKMRKLIKDMYEAQELSRTSHEQMLELCTTTVVEVLEKEIKRERRLRNITLRSATTVNDAIANLAAAQKLEHDRAVEEAGKVIDSQFLQCHKVLGLSTEAAEDIPIFMHGVKRTVVDCLDFIKESGYKVAFNNKLYHKSILITDRSPDFSYSDSGRDIKIAMWFQADGTVDCKLQKTVHTNEGKKYVELLKVKLYSMVSVDPSFYTGINKENTIRITMSVMNEAFMVYGRSNDKK